MNYFLLSLCCLLISFTLGLPHENSESSTTRKQCLVKVAEFLSEIQDDVRDPSVWALVKGAWELRLSFEELAEARYIPLHDKYYGALQKIKYPEPCDRILKQFSEIGAKVDCFTKESLDTAEGYKEIEAKIESGHVIYAGLLCSYVSRWREGGSGESASLFDFNQSKKDCLREAATSLSEVSLGGSLKEVLKLTRDFDINIVDFRHEDSRQLDRKYSRALLKIDAKDDCYKLIHQTKSMLRKVECYNEHIKKDWIAYVELSTMDKVKDIILTASACLFRKDHCENEVADLLGGISLDKSAMELVEQSRELGLTHVHFQAAMYKPLSAEDNKILLKSGYPECCDGIVQQFSEMNQNVRCADIKSFHIVFDWMEISKTSRHAGDVVLARWACAYASKLEETRLRTKPNELLEPVAMSESDKERKNDIIEVAQRYREINLDPSVKELVKELRACKITFVDFPILKYRPFDDKCHRALLEIDSKESCEKLSDEIEKIQETTEFYKKDLDSDLNSFFQLLSEDGTEDAVLADEACTYTSRYE